MPAALVRACLEEERCAGALNWLEKAKNPLEQECSKTNSLDEKQSRVRLLLALTAWQDQLGLDVGLNYNTLCDGALDETKTYLTVEPSDVTMVAGDTVRLWATIHCSNGICTSSSLMWGVAPPEGAISVDQAGLVTGIEAGRGAAGAWVSDWEFELGKLANFTILPAATIRGRVWIDRDGSGTYNSAADDTPYPSGFPGVGMVLTRQGGGVPRTASTNTDGTYEFTGLAAGTYDVWCAGCASYFAFVGDSPVGTVTVATGATGTMDFPAPGQLTYRLGSSEITEVNSRPWTFDGAPCTLVASGPWEGDASRSSMTVTNNSYQSGHVSALFSADWHYEVTGCGPGYTNVVGAWLGLQVGIPGGTSGTIRPLSVNGALSSGSSATYSSPAEIRFAVDMQVEEGGETKTVTGTIGFVLVR